MFSKACKYGLRAVLFLAAHAGEDRKLGVKEISDALDVPGPFLAKLLQQLAKARVISSTKGPHGGFYLTDKNLASNLKQVVVCLDGTEMFSSCILGLPACSAKHPCPLHDKAILYRNGLLEMLEKQTIQEMAQRVEEGQFSI